MLKKKHFFLTNAFPPVPQLSTWSLQCDLKSQQYILTLSETAASVFSCWVTFHEDNAGQSELNVHDFYKAHFLSQMQYDQNIA